MIYNEVQMTVVPQQAKGSSNLQPIKKASRPFISYRLTMPSDQQSQNFSVSCLVISKTASLMNRLLDHLCQAKLYWSPGDEILCSWNGSRDQENEIQADRGPKADGKPLFKVARRQPYHFAANINTLAEEAKGTILVLVNDDLIPDPGSIDRAVQILASQPKVGVVGGRLRSSQGLLTHAGLLFGLDGLPYNRFRPEHLGQLIDPEAPIIRASGSIPAVTGAYMIMRRNVFLDIKMVETYRVCGEDIHFCIETWRRLGLHPYYAGDVTGIHNEKTTRGSTYDHDDIEKVGDFFKSVYSELDQLRLSSEYWAIRESHLMWKLAQKAHETSIEQKSILDNQDITIENLSNSLEKATVERDKFAAELHTVREELKAAYGSTSWKISTPVRMLGNILTDRQAKD